MIVNIIDWIFIFALLLPVLYLFVFAAFSMQRRREPYPPARKQRRFVTLIPAYKADAVVVRTAQAALAQEYPEGLHRVAVIADQLQPATLGELRKLPLTVIEVTFENSSKAKALTARRRGAGARGGRCRGDPRRRQPRGRGVHRRASTKSSTGGCGSRAGAPHGQEPRHGHRGARRRGRGDQQLDLPPRTCGAGILLGADRLGHGVPLRLVLRQHPPGASPQARTRSSKRCSYGSASISTIWTTWRYWTKRCRARRLTTTSGGGGSRHNSTPSARR